MEIHLGQEINSRKEAGTRERLDDGEERISMEVRERKRGMASRVRTIPNEVGPTD